MHHRLQPKKHRFNYNVFMFYIDLNEIELLSKKLWMFSNNRFNYFSLRKDEHLQLPINNPDKTKSIREQITLYLSEDNDVDGSSSDAGGRTAQSHPLVVLDRDDRGWQSIQSQLSKAG